MLTLDIRGIQYFLMFFSELQNKEKWIVAKPDPNVRYSQNHREADEILIVHSMILYQKNNVGW